MQRKRVEYSFGGKHEDMWATSFNFSTIEAVLSIKRISVRRITKQSFTQQKEKTRLFLFVLLFVSYMCVYKMVWVFMITRFQIGYFPFEIVDCTQVSMKMPRTDDLSYMHLCVWYWRTRARRHFHTYILIKCTLAFCAPPRIPQLSHNFVYFKQT